MRLLGAVLAGGASRRFGSDKALAMLRSKPLIDHVITALAPQVAALVICGREWPPYRRLDDLPVAGLGPLGGLCAALCHAADEGFDAVLCAPCDTLGLPADLADRLAPGPAVARGQHVIGMWPATLAPALHYRLASGGSRSIRDWMAACEARDANCGPLHNINISDDLG
jgi:molybdenum cofactor guanylyltransferase